MCIEQGHVHILTFSRALGVTQCRQDGNGGVHAGEQIGHRNADFLGAAAQVVSFARHTHQATDALNSIVVACPLAVGASLAKACHAAVDQLRVHGAQAGIVQAITGHVTDLEVFHKNIAVLDQLANQALAFGLGNVASDRAFVAVGAQVIGRLGGVLAESVLQKRRAPAARVIAAARALDFDDVCTKVGQSLCTPRARQNAGKIENADAVK